jgi:tetratricopeptide (TPR) repeat protein
VEDVAAWISSRLEQVVRELSSAASSSPAGAPPPATWEEWSAEADRALARGELDRAIAALTRALEAARPFPERDPRRFSTYYRLVWAEARTGRHRRAARHARSAIAEAPRLEDAVQARLALLSLLAARYAIRLAHAMAEVLWTAADRPLRQFAPRLHGELASRLDALERTVARQDERDGDRTPGSRRRA